MFLDQLLPLIPRVLAAALVGYLLGSIPFAYLVARLKGIDIFATGSRRAGAANVFWQVGRRRGMLVFACDVVKGALAGRGRGLDAGRTRAGSHGRGSGRYRRSLEEHIHRI